MESSCKECEQEDEPGRLSDIEAELPARAYKISDAWDKEKEAVPLFQADDRICGEFIALYPPGIPIIVPGEIFDSRIINELKKYLDYGMNLQGVLSGERALEKGIIDGRGVLCVKQR